jgi:hypothetical protein
LMRSARDTAVFARSMASWTADRRSGSPQRSLMVALAGLPCRCFHRAKAAGPR